MILVTGGGGFIGRRVCQLLSAQGREVLAIDRSFPSATPYNTAQGDVCDRDFLTGLFRAHSIDAVVHLAAVLKRAAREHPEEAMRVNIGGGLELLELAEAFHVRRFIFGSSISAYGEKPRVVFGVVAENEPAAPDNVYGVTKRYIEIVGEQCRLEEKVEFVALRIAMAVGAGAQNTASRWRSEIFEALTAAQPTTIHMPFARPEGLPLIHVDDIAACIQRLIDTRQTAQTIYNTPTDNLECGELAETIHTLNPQIDFTFSPSQDRGDPEAIDGRKFSEEFGFHPVSIEGRLRKEV